MVSIPNVNLANDQAAHDLNVVPQVQLDAHLPFVSVVIPCRNEEKYIARCLDSLLANDYPHEHLEILVVDGRSQDKTRDIVAAYTRHRRHIRLVDNPERSIPAAMNAGTRAAAGDVIIKIDAHSCYRTNHIRDCVKYQREFGAENVGGVLDIQPGSQSAVARAITLALSAKFGSGNAPIKVRVDKPTWADSVAFGCYRKAFLQGLGGFNEELASSSDMDLNHRIRVAGGRILLVPSIVVEYFADATLGAFWRHNFADGVWATYVLKFKSKAWSWRHWVPLGFVASLVATLGLAVFRPVFVYVFLAIVGIYAAANLMASLHLAARKKDWEMALWLPLVFGVRHFAHGLGALYGALLVPIPGVRWRGRRSARG